MMFGMGSMQEQTQVDVNGDCIYALVQHITAELIF
jgi:hypothetical protein